MISSVVFYGDLSNLSGRTNWFAATTTGTALYGILPLLPLATAVVTLLCKSMPTAVSDVMLF